MALLGASALGLDLGLPTLITAALTTLAVLGLNRQIPLPVLRGVDWRVLPLVAGLFVLVEASIGPAWSKSWPTPCGKPPRRGRNRPPSAPARSWRPPAI